MVRISTSSSSRIGTLIYNPGGPGDEASNYLFGVEDGLPNFSPALLEAYDIIGIDPRGVGLSEPIQCDSEIYNERVSLFPKTEAEFEELLNHNERLGKSCLALSGPLLHHLDTVNVAKDMERARLALGDGEKLNFLGRSYGSQIGVTYSELYPHNINRMALDGIVDHTQSEITTLNDESTAYEDTLNQFFIWCNTTTTCALQNQDTRSIFTSILDTASKAPIPAPDCLQTTSDYACRSDVTSEEILASIQGYLLFQNDTANYPGWDILSLAIDQASKGNATLLSTELATSNTSWQYPTLAIGCQDWSHTNSLSSLLYKQSLTSITAPLTKGTTQSYYYQTACLGWPAATTNSQKPLNENALKKIPPILLVNAQHDPSTSFVWASGIQNTLPSSILLTRVGSGHTSYQLMGEAAQAIDSFLIGGSIPAANSFVYS
ncbi:hypothetical protein E2P81_ATG04437 [Venturia nashicola]|uniref:AB hydrolase-1 domain-containing protein n=1 Tax=Venturia nashicola TaxID=86259 RepID=A0A4Z1PIS2_9PEZI|nr:hypothetical protein E6O75_ATG04541 [Venturia nashicola]TLD37625.1 hypothetical protein E2P81_ATG04437 [Venturia nashicola]